MGAAVTEAIAAPLLAPPHPFVPTSSLLLCTTGTATEIPLLVAAWVWLCAVAVLGTAVAGSFYRERHAHMVPVKVCSPSE